MSGLVRVNCGAVGLVDVVCGAGAPFELAHGSVAGSYVGEEEHHGGGKIYLLDL